jgi:replication-associated recombination protein RarA
VSGPGRGVADLERGAAARAFVSKDGTRPVPLHIRNAPTRLMKDLGYGKVRELFKACQDLGFPGVSLQVIDIANRKS